MILPPLPTIPPPGAYLDRRRVASGLTRAQVADRLAALPWAIAPASADAIARLTDRLAAAEIEGQHFTAPQAALLRQIFPFDVYVYLALIDIDAAGAGCGLPVPQVCIGCGCSWHDPCTTADGGCAWSSPDPRRCTACAIAAEAAADALPGATPELEPAQ